MVVGRRRLVFAMTVVALNVSASGCNPTARSSCADLRRELDELTPTSADAWEDIAALQALVHRIRELESDIADRCPSV